MLALLELSLGAHHETTRRMLAWRSLGLLGRPRGLLVIARVSRVKYHPGSSEASLGEFINKHDLPYESAKLGSARVMFVHTIEESPTIGRMGPSKATTPIPLIKSDIAASLCKCDYQKDLYT